MAPIWESEYFPPLEHCLNGDFQLLSWANAFDRLNQPCSTCEHVRLRRYLTDEAAVEVLKNCLSPFPSATPQSKTTFDTRTSAINVAPTVQGRYDIQQIKEDALWLSSEMGMDEMSSLRITILEWQARPAHQILLQSIEPQSNNIPNDGTQTLIRCTKSPEENATEYNKRSRVRRSRIFHLYISERQYILKLAGFIVFQTVNGNAFDQGSESTIRDETSYRDLDWLENTGKTILKSWLQSCTETSVSTNWLITAIHALQKRLEALDGGSGCFKDDGREAEIEIIWSENQFIEMIHIMQLMFTLVQSNPDVPRSDVILEWFRFMYRCNFFESFQLPVEDPKAINMMLFQGNIAIVSLVMLKVSSAQQLLQEISLDSSPRVGSPNSTLYLQNPDVIQELSDIFREAAERRISIASLAVLGWGLILQTLREFANASKDGRELERSERAAVAYESTKYVEDDADGETARGEQSSAHRRRSTGTDTSQQPSYLEDVLEIINNVQFDGDLIASLAWTAVEEIHVFDFIAQLAIQFCMPSGAEYHGKVGLKIRLSLLDLIRSAAEHIEYQPITVSATLAVLTGSDRYWDMLDRPKQYRETEPAFFFLHDQFLMDAFFAQARSRFPHETLPFLELCRALAISGAPLQGDGPSLKSTLDNMDSFTCALSPEVPSNEYYKDGMMYRELAINFAIPSEQAIQEGSRFSSAGSNLDGRSAFQLSAGTKGLVMSNEDQFVVMWRCKYSGLGYMAQLLRGFLDVHHSQSQQVTENSRIVTAEIIGLVSALLMSSFCKEVNGGIATDIDKAQAVLEEASTGLDRNQDIISTVFAIFEKEMHNSQSVMQSQSSIALLMRCNEFMHALLTVLPGRVWSFLSRSSFLGLDGIESRLSSVVASTEIVSGRFGFLSGCMRFCESIVDNAMTTAISRKARPAAKTRFGQQDNGGSGVSEISMKKILLRISKVTVDIFESIPGWKFDVLEEKLRIQATICHIMLKILRYCFEMDDSPTLGTKLTGSLALAAEHLVNVFLSQSNLEVPTEPFLQTLLEGLSTKGNGVFTVSSADQKKSTIAALKLSTTLTKIQKYLGYPPGHLENFLFKSSTVLIKLYAVYEGYRVHVLDLLESLLQTYGIQDDLPPSLAGSFGPSLVKPFVEMLGALDSPSDNRPLSVAIWRFASAVVTQRQQWFAIYLLTGSTPREALKSSNISKHTALHEVRPILQIAIDRLSHLDKLQSWEAISILEFIKSAADFWPMVLINLKEESFLAAASVYLTNIDRVVVSDDGAQIQSEDPLRIQVAALIVSTLAMYVHTCRENGDTLFATKIQPNLAYLMQHAVTPPKYNASLHSNLRKNFELKFPQCDISNFKRTSLERSNLGSDYYYDIQMASQMLSFDPVWSGKSQQGFIEEFRRANNNLSIVEGRVSLLYAWEFFVVELSYALQNDASFHTSIIVVVQKCLEANTEYTLPETLMRRLTQSRVDLAFTLTQQVSKIVPTSAEAKSILEPAWNTLRHHAPNLGTALTGADADYDRTLLKLLYVALQIHALDEPKPKDRRGSVVEAVIAPHIERIVLEILGTLVAQGFRSLTTSLHDSASSISPMDFVLINAILRTALCIHNVERHSTQLISHFTDDQTARYATTLLSWSDRLTVDNDPVYGEVSIMFLTELSAVSPLAESIAVEGILAQISNAVLMDYFRHPGGIGPFEQPTRMHRIWSRGVLPLIINLLRAVGAPIAGEISRFLAQFQNQISRAANSFDVKLNGSFKDGIHLNYITLNIASEAHSLTLITTILDNFRQAGPSIGIVAVDIAAIMWEKTQLREDISSWMQQRKALREIIIATNEREETWTRHKPLNTDSGSENRLEEKIVAEMSATIALLDGHEI